MLLGGALPNQQLSLHWTHKHILCTGPIFTLHYHNPWDPKPIKTHTVNCVNPSQAWLSLPRGHWGWSPGTEVPYGEIQGLSTKANKFCPRGYERDILERCTEMDCSPPSLCLSILSQAHTKGQILGSHSHPVPHSSEALNPFSMAPFGLHRFPSPNAPKVYRGEEKAAGECPAPAWHPREHCRSSSCFSCSCFIQQGNRWSARSRPIQGSPKV